MVAKAKLYAQLDRLEEELRERVVPLLESAAAGKNGLVFCTVAFNSLPEFKHRTNDEMDALIQLGRKILSLQEKLGEPSEGSVAARICWYCQAWSLESGPLKSAQTLAAEFLNEIR